MKWLCKFLGHKFRDIDVAILKIKAAAINSSSLEKKIRCYWCGFEIDASQPEKGK